MNSLPIIHPLREDGPPRDPNGECLCNWCRHWHPIIQHVEAQLDEEGKKLFNEYVEHMMYAEEDGDVAEAKLAGNWPGWEFMKALKDWDDQTHKPVISLEPISPDQRERNI